MFPWQETWRRRYCPNHRATRCSLALTSSMDLNGGSPVLLVDEIRTIEQAVSVGTKLPLSWFRGHCKCWCNLTPTVFRPKPRSERGGYREYYLTERFRLRAASIESNLPAWDDHLRWLLLMQHHGLPTRLLDWTESILAALYFAVRDSVREAGEIWCIRPDALNNQSGYYLCSGAQPIVQHLAAQAFTSNPTLFFDGAIANKPMAFLPPINFRRMSAQSSRFTIHPEPDGKTIEALLSNTNRPEITRYVVPADCKTSLSRDLTALEITEETLFCTLDALSTTIKIDVYDLDCGGQAYPEPPRFSSLERS